MRDISKEIGRNKRMINKLVEKIKKTNAPIVVGLDPMMKFIPGHITDKAFAAMKKDGSIVSPVRCKWEPAQK